MSQKYSIIYPLSPYGVQAIVCRTARKNDKQGLQLQSRHVLPTNPSSRLSLTPLSRYVVGAVGSSWIKVKELKNRLKGGRLYTGLRRLAGATGCSATSFLAFCGGMSYM